MSIVLRRALMRELGEWATKPVAKITGLIFAFVLVVGALWLTKFLVDAGSIVAALQQLKAVLGLQLPSVIS